MCFSNVNYLSIVGAALASNVVAVIWYSKYLFKKKWMKFASISKKDLNHINKQLPQRLLLSFITSLITAFVLSQFILGASVPISIFTAFLIWIGIIVPFSYSAVIWENMKQELWVIDASYVLISLVVMSIILSLFS